MIIPTIMHFNGQAPPSIDERKAWHLAHLDIATQFERMLGRTTDMAQTGTIVVASAEPLLDTGEVNTSLTTFAQVERGLRAAGRNPDLNVYSVCAMGTGGGGRAAPRPSPFAWYNDPKPGGIAAVGYRHLRSLTIYGRPGLNQKWTSSRRRAWFTNVALMTHELCHVGGLPHYGGDPEDPAFGRLTLTNYNTWSGVDRWWLGKLQPDGTYAGMLTNGLWSGGQFSEHDTLRANPNFGGPPAGEFLRLDPGERNSVLSGAMPAHQGLGHGKSVWEYML